jgi:hypothetical protein
VTASLEAVVGPLLLLAVSGMCVGFAMLASWAAMNAVLWLMRRATRLAEGAGARQGT